MDDPAHVLIVEDDPSVRQLLTVVLPDLGCRVTVLDDSLDVGIVVAADPPDLVLLDRGLPSGDGLATARSLHDSLGVPIVMITGAGAAEDRILGHAAGVDRYLVKPFEVLELQLAIKALLRRARPPGRRRITTGDVVIDVAAHRVTIAGSEVSLPGKQFAILKVLAENGGVVVPKRRLLGEIWGFPGGDPNLVEVQVTALRRQLAGTSRCSLSTVRGRGYRLEVMND
jgi:DNA-binding response OmpR family regulator